MSITQLKIGQTVDPGKCGSCKSFCRFDSEDVWGSCRIVMPPWVQPRPIQESGRDYTRVRDTDFCDLHRSTGLTYVVSRLVKP